VPRGKSETKSFSRFYWPRFGFDFFPWFFGRYKATCLFVSLFLGAHKIQTTFIAREGDPSPDNDKPRVAGCRGDTNKPRKGRKGQMFFSRVNRAHRHVNAEVRRVSHFYFVSLDFEKEKRC
jgi:hypothetical protein